MLWVGQASESFEPPYFERSNLPFPPLDLRLVRQTLCNSCAFQPTSSCWIPRPVPVVQSRHVVGGLGGRLWLARSCSCTARTRTRVPTLPTSTGRRTSQKPQPAALKLRSASRMLVSLSFTAGILLTAEALGKRLACRFRLKRRCVGQLLPEQRAVLAAVRRARCRQQGMARRRAQDDSGSGSGSGPGSGARWPLKSVQSSRRQELQQGDLSVGKRTSSSTRCWLG